MKNEYNYQENIVSGCEQYKCSFTKDEYLQLYKIYLKKQKNVIIRISIILIIFNLLLLPLNHNASLISSCICLLYIILLIAGFFKTRKSWFEKSNNIENRYQIFDIFEDKISISEIENNEFTKKYTVPYDTINSVDESDDIIAFSDNANIFSYKKSILNDNSILFDIMSEKKDKNIKQNKLLHTAYAFTYISISLILLIPMVIDAVKVYLGNPCLWIYFVAIPFPVTSVIFSFVLKKHKIKYLANLILGILITIILIIYGCGQIGYNKYYNSGYNIIAETEEKLGIDIPTPDYIEFYNDTESEDSRIKIINDVAVEYYELDYADDDGFIDQIFTDDIWLEELPDSFYNIIPFTEYYSYPDYAVLYNVNTQEINTPPKDKGTHQLVFIAYNYGYIDIIEYNITL